MADLNGTSSSSTDSAFSNDDVSRLFHLDELRRLLKFIQTVHISEEQFLYVFVKILGKTSLIFMLTSLLGVLTNILNLAVFYRQGILADSYTATTTALALSDLVVCLADFAAGGITLILDAADRNHPKSTYQYENLEGFYLKPGPTSYIQAVTFILQLPSFPLFEFNGWTTAYLTVERMVSVAFPFRVKMLFTPKRTCAVIAFIFLCTNVTEIPRFMSYKLIWKETVGAEGRHYRLTRVLSDIADIDAANDSSLVVNTIFRPVYIIIIVLSNIVIAVKVTISQRFRKSATTSTISTTTSTTTIPSNSSTITQPSSPMNKSTEPEAAKVRNNSSSSNAKGGNNHHTKKENRLLRMIIVLSATFLLSRVPSMYGVIMHKIQENISDYWGAFGSRYNDKFFLVTRRVGEYCIILNGATNFFIYFNLSQKFRNAMGGIMMICCGDGKKN